MIDSNKGENIQVNKFNTSRMKRTYSQMQNLQQNAKNCHVPLHVKMSGQENAIILFALQRSTVTKFINGLENGTNFKPWANRHPKCGCIKKEKSTMV